MSASNAGSVRINITIPGRLLVELKREVPDGRKSGFIAEAIEEKLVRDKRARALDALSKLPPTFSAVDDGAAYISDEREREERDRSSRFTI